MLSRTCPQVRIAPTPRDRHAATVTDEPILYREEAVRMMLALYDLVEIARDILRVLEGGNGEEE
jgi:hypothetical protein